MEPTSSIMQPIAQFGFAGVSAVLLGILIWVVKLFIAAMQSHHTAVVELTKSTMSELHNNTVQFTHAFESANMARSQQLKVLEALHDRLVERPCLLPRFHDDGK